MNRGYQHDYSTRVPSAYDHENRRRKAATTLAVLEDFLGDTLQPLSVLVVGSSTGIIDHELAQHSSQVMGFDIDQPGINYANQTFIKDNLGFALCDAMQLACRNDQFDIVVCSHVYEHVPDATVLMREIFRALKPGGVCYFGAGNRLAIREPHHGLPFLSILPVPLAHLYMRLAGKGKFYYERHRTFWGLRRLVRDFAVTDYSCRIINDPQRFHAAYMLPPGSLKQRVARLLCRFAAWALPGYIWILKKPVSES